MADEAVLVDWDIEELPSILIFEKLALCHRPTPLTTNLREALSSRVRQRNQNWRMSTAIHRDRMLHIRSTASFRFRSALAYDFGLLLFRPRIARPALRVGIGRRRLAASDPTAVRRDDPGFGRADAGRGGGTVGVRGDGADGGVIFPAGHPRRAVKDFWQRSQPGLAP